MEMTERVEIGDAVLYHGDCREILPTLGKVDAVVTDPPYGVSYKSPANGRGHKAQRGDYAIIAGDTVPFDPAPWLNFPDVILFGANYFADKLPISAAWLVWDKRCGAVAANNNSDCELAWKNNGGSARVIRHLWSGMLKDSERDSKRTHPTQKPIAVMEWAIQQIKSDPKTILDPFAGVGSTGVACANLGRKFIGIEIERKYFDIACERIAAAQAQGRLFAPDVVKPKQSSLLDSI